MERRGKVQSELVASSERGGGKYYTYEIRLQPTTEKGGEPKTIWGVTAIGVGGTEAARK